MRRICNWQMACAFVLAGLFAPALVFAQSRDVTPRVAPAVQRGVERAIRPVLDEMMRAANAHDTDRFLAAYLHSPDFVFAINGEVISGIDSVRALQLKWWNNGKSDVAYSEASPAQIRALTPDIALVVQTLKASRTLPDGAVSGGQIAVTYVWQRLAEGWRVIEVHESTAR